MRIPALFLALGLAAPAWASGGTPVSIKVVDAGGEPIASAVVRHPEEKERHRVNMATGIWTGDAVYLADGTELLFERNLELTLEVSAPGYQNKRFSYIVKKRKNLAVVQLDKLDLEVQVSDEEESGPVIGFKHDNPRD
ncbi:MAG: hypothetical protein H6737_02090 [Alphaproteobacteria bacterium]|nr:hypothetical protein [Alphaproteobacteria bacterium]